MATKSNRPRPPRTPPVVFSKLLDEVGDPTERHNALVRAYNKEVHTRPMRQGMLDNVALMVGDKRGSRLGIPNGFGGRPKELQALRAKAQTFAKEMVAHMIKENIAAPENDLAVEALEFAITVVRTPGMVRDKLAAARMVLDFTKQKPATKLDATVRKAEDFLTDIVADMAK